MKVLPGIGYGKHNYQRTESAGEEPGEPAEEEEAAVPEGDFSD